MNKRLPCYIVSDLLPLYQDDILSEQTKKDIDKHLTECRECQKKMAAMKTQLDIQNTNVDLKINQKNNQKKGKVKIISVFPDIKIPPYRTFIHHCPIWGASYQSKRQP